MYCPANQSLETTPGLQNAVAVWQDPTVVDTSGNRVKVTCNPLSGSEFPIGQTWVTCDAVDRRSNSTCVFQIGVKGTFGFNLSIQS